MAFDCIVIGSGFGGSISAYELSKSGLNVCLIERGPWRESKEVNKQNVTNVAPLPAGFNFLKYATHCIHHRWLPTGKLRLNKAGLFEIFSSKDINIICSNSVGGGSHVYAGLHARPFQKNYWDTVTQGLSSKEMNKHYDAIIKLLNSKPAPELKGITDYKLTPEYPELANNQKPHWGYAKDLSCNGWVDQTDFTQEGMFGSATGAKTTLDRALLLPAINQYNLTIKAQTEVLYLEKRDHKFFIHCKNLTTGGINVFTAPKVILAAGCINTVRILADSVKKKQIKRLPMLGKNFSANADMAAIWKVDSPSSKSYGPYERIFTSNNKGKEQFELMQAGVSGLNAIPIPEWIKSKLMSYRFLAGMGVDESNGHINIENNKTEIFYKAQKNPIIAILKMHFERIEKLSGKKVILPKKLTTVHPMGGAIISESSSSGVINFKGESHEVPGLYICDSSVFPKALGAPPSLSVAAWARHVCHQIQGSALP